MPRHVGDGHAPRTFTAIRAKQAKNRSRRPKSRPTFKLKPRRALKVAQLLQAVTPTFTSDDALNEPSLREAAACCSLIPK